MLSVRISESEQCPEWKALLTELLAAIAKCLTSIDDYASFRCVCTSWRAAATFHNFDTEFPRFLRLVYFSGKSEEAPILLGDALAGKREETPIIGDALVGKSEETSVFVDDFYVEREETPVHLSTVANLLDLESNTCKRTNFPPVPDDYKCTYVSCSGWILVGDEPQLSLKHFMLGINIKLPELGTFVTKMVLSGSPIEAEADLLVMVIYSCDDQLAFCRPGDESWTEIDGWEYFFYDIIYHNNKLYALNDSLGIVECDVRGSNPTKMVRVFYFRPNVDTTIFSLIVHKYLVESFGKFLIVVRYEYRTGNESHYFKYPSGNESHYFRVFEIELNDGSYKEIDNLGNRCLFLGLNSSICVDFPASSSVKLNLNCIYSAEKKRYTCKPDVGVYKLCDELYDGRFEDFSGMFDSLPAPLWVLPSF